MPRIRTIKPEFWTDRRLASLSREHRLAFVGLWTYANDFGKGCAHPKQLAGEVFPHDDDVDAAWMRIALDAMADGGFIELWEADGERYYGVRHWEHQRVDNPGADRLPDYDLAQSFRFSREPLATPSRASRPIPPIVPRIVGSRIKDLGSVAPAAPNGLVAAFAEDCAEFGSAADSRAKARVGAETKRLLDEGRSPENLRSAVRELARRNVSPTFLAAILGDIERLQAGTQLGRPIAAPIRQNGHDARIQAIREGRT